MRHKASSPAPYKFAANDGELNLAYFNRFSPFKFFDVSNGANLQQKNVHAVDEQEVNDNDHHNVDDIGVDRKRQGGSHSDCSR
mmetsp:Transcript_20318/g.49803  ORF Transcript_20318/g.49803 Transcript_20318/m.49803 type:complete len:83 (-) Transcript_20318:213-461(-)